nr:hypothetical protein [uncultured Oscillibacter sp.]
MSRKKTKFRENTARAQAGFIENVKAPGSCFETVTKSQNLGAQKAGLYIASVKKDRKSGQEIHGMT